MVFLIVVIGATVLAGKPVGILASFVGFALFNFFLVPPYLTFEIRDLENILALFVFLGVSSLLSWLIAGRQEQARQAHRRAEYVSKLHEFSQSIAAARHTNEVLPAIAFKVVELFDAESCWLLMPDAGRRLLVRAHAPPGARQLTREELSLAEWSFLQGSRIGQSGQDRSPAITTGPQMGTDPKMDSDHDGRTTFVPLRAGMGTIGVLAVGVNLSKRSLTSSERTVLFALADQAAAAMERLSLLQEAQRAETLARTDELKSALISAVSHDLRTPLASIIAAVTSLQETGIDWDDATRREFLQAIYDEARRLDRLVGNLLDMSRIEAGALKPQREWYTIAEVLESVTQRLDDRAGSHPLHLDIAPNLPDLLFDFSQIDQVVTNLVENAIKHTPDGTPITIRVRQVGAQVEVSVSDRGPGVPDEHLRNLFSRFYRVYRTPHVKDKGMGLGLAISKGLVEANGGTIGAANQPGGGLDVTFRLPVPPAPDTHHLLPATYPRDLVDA
jgi:two-component system sensor histidine kinase KdpD